MKKNTGHLENEFYRSKIVFPLYERQIYDLFGLFADDGEGETLKYLSSHASTIATLHALYHRNSSYLFSVDSDDIIQTHVDTTYQQLLSEAQKPNHTLTLIETITAQTVRLLGYAYIP